MAKPETEYQIVNEYRSVARRMLRLSFPNVLDDELDRALDYSIKARLTNNPATIYNNYSDKSVELTVLDVCDYILERQPIITSYGVLFTRKGERPNPIARLLQSFMDGRTAYKDKMFTFPKGSEEFEKYNLLQLLAKLDAKLRWCL